MAPLKSGALHHKVRPPVPIPRTAPPSKCHGNPDLEPPLGSQTVDTITRRTAGRLLPRSDTPDVSDPRISIDAELAGGFLGNLQILNRCVGSVSKRLTSYAAADRALTFGPGFMASCELLRRPPRLTRNPVFRCGRGPRQGQRRQRRVPAACRATAGPGAPGPCAAVHAGRTCSADWQAAILRSASDRTAHPAMPAGPARRPANRRGGPGQCLCELLIDTPEARLVPETRKAPRGAGRDISIDLHPGPCTQRLAATQYRSGQIRGTVVNVSQRPTARRVTPSADTPTASARRNHAAIGDVTPVGHHGLGRGRPPSSVRPCPSGRLPATAGHAGESVVSTASSVLGPGLAVCTCTSGGRYRQQKDRGSARELAARQTLGRDCASRASYQARQPIRRWCPSTVMTGGGTWPIKRRCPRT